MRVALSLCFQQLPAGGTEPSAVSSISSRFISPTCRFTPTRTPSLIGQSDRSKTASQSSPKPVGNLFRERVEEETNKTSASNDDTSRNDANDESPTKAEQTSPHKADRADDDNTDCTEDSKRNEIDEQVTLTMISRATSPSPPSSSGTFVTRRRADVARLFQKEITRSRKRPETKDAEMQSDRMDDTARYSRFGSSTSRVTSSPWSSYIDKFASNGSAARGYGTSGSGVASRIGSFGYPRQADSAVASRAEPSPPGSAQSVRQESRLPTNAETPRDSHCRVNGTPSPCRSSTENENVATNDDSSSYHTVSRNDISARVSDKSGSVELAETKNGGLSTHGEEGSRKRNSGSKLARASPRSEGRLSRSSSRSEISGSGEQGRGTCSSISMASSASSGQVEDQPGDVEGQPDNRPREIPRQKRENYSSSTSSRRDSLTRSDAASSCKLEERPGDVGGQPDNRPREIPRQKRENSTGSTSSSRRGSLTRSDAASSCKLEERPGDVEGQPDNRPRELPRQKRENSSSSTSSSRRGSLTRSEAPSSGKLEDRPEDVEGQPDNQPRETRRQKRENSSSSSSSSCKLEERPGNIEGQPDDHSRDIARQKRETSSSSSSSRRDSLTRSEASSSNPTRSVSRNSSGKSLPRKMTRNESSDSVGSVSVPTGRTKSSSACSSLTCQGAKIRTGQSSSSSGEKSRNASVSQSPVTATLALANPTNSLKQPSSPETRGKPPVPKSSDATAVMKMPNNAGKYVNKDFRKSALNMENGEPSARSSKYSDRKRSNRDNCRRSISASSQDSEANSESVPLIVSSGSSANSLKSGRSIGKLKIGDRASESPKTSNGAAKLGNSVSRLLVVRKSKSRSKSPSRRKNSVCSETTSSSSDSSSEESTSSCTSSDEGCQQRPAAQDRPGSGSSGSKRRRKRTTSSPRMERKTSAASSRTSILLSSADESSLTMDKPPRPPSSPRSRSDRSAKTEEAKSFLMRALAPVTNLFKGKHQDSGSDGWPETEIPNEDASETGKRPTPSPSLSKSITQSLSKSLSFTNSSTEIPPSDRGRCSGHTITRQMSGEKPWWLDPNSDNVPDGVERVSACNDEISQETTISTMLPDDGECHKYS